MKRPKLILGILCFILAGLRISQHVWEYRNDKKPTGLQLVSATLNILTGILSIMSDALEQKSSELDAEDFVLEDDFDLDSAELCCCDCETCDCE